MSAVERGLVEYAFMLTVPSAVIWLILESGRVGRWVVAAARRIRLLPPLPELTYDPPLERIAADLRRLSEEMRHPAADISVVKRNSVRMAYDDCLIAACRALDVPQSLREAGDGLDLEIERLRVETALEEAGLRFRLADH